MLFTSMLFPKIMFSYIIALHNPVRFSVYLFELDISRWYLDMKKNVTNLSECQKLLPWICLPLNVLFLLFHFNTIMSMCTIFM